MRNKVYWGLGVLIILIIATTTVVVIRLNNETQRLKDELAQLEEAQKKTEKTPHTVDFSETKPPDEPGYKWVRHGDHWDKVPISNPTGPIEHHNVPIADVSNDSDTNYVEFSMSEELARVREIDLEHVPKRIEFYKNAIPKAEERYNNLSTYIQKYPDADKWLREQLDHYKKTLESYRASLLHHEYRLALIRKEESEANNEKK